MFIIANIDKGCRIEGFIYSYIFWLAIFSFLLLRQKTAWVNYIIGTFLLWSLFVYIIISENLKMDSEIIGSFIVMLCTFVIGWLLAQGILLVYKQVKK